MLQLRVLQALSMLRHLQCLICKKSSNIAYTLSTMVVAMLLTVLGCFHQNILTYLWKLKVSFGLSGWYFTDLTFNSTNFFIGETTKTATLMILDDPEPEDDESILVRLVHTEGGSRILPSADTVTVNILANDNVAGIVSFQTASRSVIGLEGVSLSLLNTFWFPQMLFLSCVSFFLLLLSHVFSLCRLPLEESTWHTWRC